MTAFALARSALARAAAAWGAPLACAALLMAAGCRQARSKVVPLAPEVAQMQGQESKSTPSGDAPRPSDADPRLIYRHSRNDERAHLPSLSDALTRLGVLDAQVEQEAAGAAAAP